MKKLNKNYLFIGGALLVIFLLNKLKKKPVTTMVTNFNSDNNFNNFQKITDLVIKKLEGGYYHPDMMTKDPEKFKDYGSSGETMYGLDRHAGHNLYYKEERKAKDVKTNLKYIPFYTYSNDASKQFWGYLDKINARNNWKWNFKPEDPTGKNLRYLAAAIIYPAFIRNFNTFLNEKARTIVLNSAPLLFNFSYATWNGSLWFKKFASDINEAVNKGITDEKSLIKIALNSRTKEGIKKGSAPNKLIKQGGEKIATFINEIKF